MLTPKEQHITSESFPVLCGLTKEYVLILVYAYLPVLLTFGDSNQPTFRVGQNIWYKVGGAAHFSF